MVISYHNHCSLQNNDNININSKGKMLDFANLQYTNLSPECWYWNVSKQTIYIKHLSDTEQELEKKV